MPADYSANIHRKPTKISIGRRKHHSYPHAQREDNHASIRHIHPTSLQPPSNSMRHTGIRPKYPVPCIALDPNGDTPLEGELLEK